MQLIDDTKVKNKRPKTSDTLRRARVLPNGDVYIDDLDTNVTGIIKSGVTGDYNNLRGNEQMGLEVQGYTIKPSNSMSHIQTF